MLAPLPVMIAGGEVHVWHIDLSLAIPAAWEQSLGQHEQERAACFATGALQMQYRRTHGSVRAILARYTGMAPAAIEFIRLPFGKPALANSGIAFNLSHSGARALLAVARVPLGIDIEYMDGRLAVAELFDMVCQPAEKAHLLQCDGEVQRREFYALWTRKEAYLKALGTGLQTELAAIAFMAGPQDGIWSVIHAGGGDGGAAAAWQVQTLAAGPDYAASICLPQPGMRIIHHACP